MDSIPQQICLQIILILINAFFASTEIAVISLNGTKLKKMAQEGDKTARRLLKLVEEPAGFLSTIQIGITLAGFLGSAFAADNFSEYLVTWIYDDLGFHALPVAAVDTLAVIVITLILSYFTLIFGELVPKRIAMQKPYEVAKLSCGVVSGVALVMRPVVAFLSLSTNAVLRLLRMRTEASEENVTEEEIRMMVDLGEEKGVIDADEKNWIHNVFAFDDTCVREIMVHSADVVRIFTGSSPDEIVKIIKDSGLSRIPVCHKDINDIIGILYVRDYLEADSEGRACIQELVRPAYFIPETMAADDLFKDMQRKKIHFAVVVDEFGEIAGIITMEDLLEEIVGNIYDEYDRPEPNEVEQIDGNHWRVDGDCNIETVTEALGVPLELSADYDTVGGLIFSHLHTIPKDGAIFEINIGPLVFHVTRIENRRVMEVIIEIPRGEMDFQ